MITPSLVVGWLIATAVVLIAGVLATLGTGTPYVPLLAPALAAAGIAYAYGPGIDPAWELTRSMAVSDRMVLLVRALAVFGINAALGLVASAASGAAAAFTFGWLVPMTAACRLALAAATVARSANVGVAAGMSGWPITVLAGRAAAGTFYPYLHDLPIARVMLLGGIAVGVLGLLGVPAGSGGPRLRLAAAMVTVAEIAAAGVGISLAGTARLGQHGIVIPALHDAASDRPIPYTPACGRAAGVPVCLQPAYAVTCGI